MCDQNNKFMKKPSVLIVQTIVPHYVLPLFQKLTASIKMNVTIAYGQAPIGASLQNVSNPKGIVVSHVKNIYFNKKNTIRFQLGLLSLLWSRHFDIVIMEFDLHIISNLIGCLLAKCLGLQIIWWGHGIGPRRRRLSKWIRILLIRLSDAVIFYDSENANRFVSWGVDKKKLFIAWNSIDIDEIRPFVIAWDSNDRFRILYIGRLIPEKKVDMLIEGFGHALPYLTPLDPRFQLTIIGDGPERKALERLVSKLAITAAVEFTGALYSQQQLAQYFNTAMVSVSPGCIGLSAVHSMAYGIPLLVADNEPHGPEICAVKNNINSLLFSSGNAQDLAQKLIQMAGEPDMMMRMSAGVLRTIEEQFSMQIMTKAFEDAVQHAHKKT